MSINKQSFEKSLGWEVSEHDVLVQGKAAPRHKAICNGENIIQISGKSYTPFLNSEFEELATEIGCLADFKEPRFATIDGGKRVLAFLENPEKGKKVAGLDIKDYMLIGNGHDGNTALWIGTSTIVHRCNNMFTKENMKIRFSHTRSIHDNVLNLKAEIAGYHEDLDELYKTFENWSTIKIAPKIKEDMKRHLTAMEREDTPENISTRKLNLYNGIDAGIARECTELGDNLWGLFNGVTYFTTHDYSRGKPESLNATGGGANMNIKAFDKCRELATVLN